MHSTASAIAPSPATEVRYDHEWHRAGRGGFDVHIAWNYLQGGTAACGIVHDRRGGEPHAFALELDAAPATLALVHADGSFIDVTLALVTDGDRVSLNCNMPTAVNEYFQDSIGHCPLGPGPSPDPQHPGDDAEIIIEAPADTTDLVSFIWLRPLSDAEAADAALRFVRCRIPALLTLYAGLAAAKKISDATAYIGGSDFVSDISALGPAISLFPAARQEWAKLDDDRPIDDLVFLAEMTLAVPSLTAFLAEPASVAALLRVWKSIFALALVEQPLDTALSNQLLDILRVFQYLAMLAKADEALVKQRCRQIALAAIVTMPDNIALLPPASTLAGADSAVPPNTWEVLGVGKLKLARQHLAGYAPGELADVVNVMPRERQEKLERTVTTTSEHDSHATEQLQQDETSRATSAASELADTIHEVMAADGMAVNMQSVEPDYGNLNLLLTGTGSRSQGRSGWSSADTSRMVQRLTEQAAKRLGDRVSSQRGKEWQELRERRQSQLIDNRGNERLVGVYRWVDRVVRVHIEELGGRLVLGFDLQQPAHAWVVALAAQGTAPLVAPLALPADYSAISADNYQALGAQYGLLALEPPPPSQLVLSTSITRVTLGDLSLLCVPDGYSVTSAALTVGSSDSTYTIACSIGGHDLPTTSPAPVAALSVAVPACAPTSTGPMVVAPPNQPISVISTTTIASLPITKGRIPITVMSAAPLFCVTATLTCTLDQVVAGSGTSLLNAWKIRTFDALRGAWQNVWRAYDGALGARIAQSSAGHTGEVQRDTLKRACLALLLQVGAKPGTSQRSLEPMFDWAHMSWQFQSPTSVSGNNWPQNPGSEATRPASERLFQRFLTSQAARVLLPVSVGWESGLLFYLQFQRLWSAGPAVPPMTESTLPIIEELLRTDPEAVGGAPTLRPQKPRGAAEHWTVRVPTSMIYLQDGAELPRMYRHFSPTYTE